MTRLLAAVLLTMLAIVAPAQARQKRIAWPHVPWPPKIHVVEVADTAGPCRNPQLPPIECAVTWDQAPDFGTVYTTDAHDRFVVNHGAGHLFDAELLTDSDRALLMRYWHLRGPWDGGTGNGALESPSEWAADYYARCRLHQTSLSKEQYISYTGSVSPKRTLRVCAVFVAAAARAGIT